MHRNDVAPYNIRTTLVEPGFFRTELLVDASTTWPEPRQNQRPLRFVAGDDTIEGVERKAKELVAQAQASRELGGNLAY